MLYVANRLLLKQYFVLLINLLWLLLFNVSCSQTTNKHVLKNKSLPKEIKLDPGTHKIIDSVFVFKNGKQHLESVQLFELEHAVLVSAHREYYKNDTINQTTKEVFDANGNNIESNTFLHFKNSSQVFKRKLDEAGNIMELISIEDGKTSILEYENVYANSKLVSATVISKRNGSVIKKTINKYDLSGNLTEELNNSLSVDANNFYWYNEANQVLLHKHVRNGVLHDSIVYHYTNGLLDKEFWYENPPSSPMITTYQYNEKKQPVAEIDENFGNSIYYKQYNAFGNWQVREQHSSGELSRVTKRVFMH